MSNRFAAAGWLLAFCLCLFHTAGAVDHVWIEGENPTTTPKLNQVEGVEKLKGDGKGYQRSGWGNLNVFSEGKMLHVGLDPASVSTFVPESGMIFGYDFELRDAAKQHIWARVGWEFVRSDFDWRIDNGEWKSNTTQNLTTNVQPIQTWNELGWVQLGSLDLKAGKHKIEIRLNKHPFKDKKGKMTAKRILYGLDCLCITPARFQPDGKWKPDQDHRSDADKKAESNVFRINAGDGSADRVKTVLNGLWSTAAWDETPLVDEATRLGPVKTLPNLKDLRWFAYSAPGDRNSQHPEMLFSHRYLLRTKLDVPAELKGRGFFLDVQRSSLIISVFVNGTYADWTKTFLTAWQLDLTPHIKPGKVNELVLVVKDAYYSLNPAKDKRLKNNRSFWNIPIGFLSRNQGTCANHDMPVASDTRTGLLEPATLVVCGPVYTSDVFAKPSVKQKKLGLEVTLRNPGANAVTVELANKVIPWNQGKGGKAECLFAAQKVTIPAGKTSTVNLEQAWANPHLWWPDDPHLYWNVTELKVGGKVVDSRRTRFGFREWDWSTHMFKLNGIKWTMWADISSNNSDPRKQVKISREESHQNHMRLWASGGLGGMTRRETLDYFDETGMLVRSSGVFDGQVANYGGGLVETDPDAKPDKRGRKPRRAKKHFFANWSEHLADWIREERNHASIYIWSLENEITYINVNNLGMAREVEPAIRDCGLAAMKVDSTRPVMVDGGNCLRDESLPVNGAHYTEFMNGGWRDMPDLAYTREQYYDKNRPQRGAWRMVPDRPIMKGEVYFANGYTTDRFASIGGDRCFIGRGETRHARGVFAKVLSEGYRWAEVASWQFWMGGEADHLYWNSWSPVAVLCRQWNWCFGEKTKITRTLKVFNSTRHADPIEASWELHVDGKKVAGDTKTFTIAPGEAEAWEIGFSTPAVSKRTSGVLKLTAKRGGKEVFKDTKSLAVIAPDSIAKPGLTRDQLAVFDPKGTTKAYLTKRGIGFTDVTDAGKVPAGATHVVVGADAISADTSADTSWYALAASGRKVLILDQAHPLHYRAIPANLKPTSYTGRFGFGEDMTHPIFTGLKQMDFFCWGNDHVMYRNAYRKGTRGGRSLFHCDESLGCTALVESQVGDGLLVLSQLAIGEKLASLGIAQAVFNNLLNYVAAYKPVRKETLVAIQKDKQKIALLDSVDLKYKKVNSPLDAFKAGQIAVVDATPANLKILAENKAKVDAFSQSGGWLMLWGLTPEGLADYNQVVGENHVIRPFEQERVLLNYPQDRVASGLTLRDVVMDTGEKMYGWMALKKPDRDGFKFVVDHTDIAPFCTFPKPMELGKPSNDNPGIDHWPRNMVNCFTSDDNWAFTYTIIMDRGDKRKFTLTLPKEEELVALRIRPSRIYHPITKMKIYFDDDPTPVEATIPVRGNPITEDIPIKGRRAKRLTLEVAEWAERGNANIVVIDNLWLQVKRSDSYMKNVKSLLNIGALMRYTRGKGGILLNQVNLVESEKNPINARKKSKIVKTLLKNIGAVFNGGGRTVVAGAGLSYQPVKIPDGKFNAYAHGTGKPGWFLDGKRGTMKALPVGEQTFANIDFYLSDFNTSPVPSVFMLKCRGSKAKKQEIKDILIGRKADSLFFLHNYQAEQAVSQYERSFANWSRRKRGPAPEKPWVFKYVVKYNDGTTVDVPVVYGEHIGRWVTGKSTGYKPGALPAAALAWVGDTKGEEKIALYAMQWNNPHHDKVIKSIDIVNRENGKYGAPAVFAVTTATVIK